MFSALRATTAPRTFTRAFSTSQSRADLAKLVLVGRLAKDPEARLTKNDKEFITYTVATRGASLPANENGERLPGPSNFHRVLSFGEGPNKYLRTLRKGTLVYVEAGYDVKEPAPDADSTTPQGQRQIFLKHESIRILAAPRVHADSSTETHTEKAVESESESGSNERPFF